MKRFIISPIKGLDVKSNAGAPAFRLCRRFCVPKGQSYALTGTLWRSALMPSYRLYVLDLPDGGGWLLDTPRNVDHLIGRRVHIEGTRWDFVIINVDRIWAEGEPRPLLWRERLARMMWWRPL